MSQDRGISDNKGLNKFQSIMGLLMFSENSLKSLQSITSQIGLAVANSSTQKRLYSMSAVVSEKNLQHRD